MWIEFWGDEYSSASGPAGCRRRRRRRRGCLSSLKGNFDINPRLETVVGFFIQAGQPK
jgi:hypothetical protein